MRESSQSILSTHHVGSKDRTQVSRLVSKLLVISQTLGSLFEKKLPEYNFAFEARMASGPCDYQEKLF